MNTEWELFSSYFDGGIVPYGEILSIVLTGVLCSIAFWKAWKIYKEL